MLGSYSIKVKAVFVRKEPLQTLDYMDLLVSLAFPSASTFQVCT